MYMCVYVHGVMKAKTLEEKKETTYITGHLFVLLHQAFIFSVHVQDFTNTFGSSFSLLKQTLKQ